MNHYEFFWKVLRNAFILAGMQFFSLLAFNDFSDIPIKAIGAFFGLYVCTELAHYFRVDNKATIKTLIL